MFLISYSFFVFVLVLLLVYYLVPGKVQWMVLLAASVLFYLWAGAEWVIFPLLTVLTTWTLAGRIGKLTLISKEEKKNPQISEEQRKENAQKIKQKQRRLLKAGLFFNFGLLLGLKYPQRKHQVIHRKIF